MNGKLVVLKSQTDNFEITDYDGYESLSKGVGGLIEHFCSKSFEGNKIDFWCNEEFTYSDDPDCQYANAIASFMSGQTIYGNVVISVSLPMGDSRGFTDAELKSFTGFIESKIKSERFEKTAKAFHEENDHNRPEPEFGVFSLNVEKIDRSNLSLYFDMPLGSLYWKGDNGYEIVDGYTEGQLLKYICKNKDNEIYFIGGAEKTSDEVSKLIEQYKKEQKEMAKLMDELGKD